MSIVKEKASNNLPAEQNKLSNDVIASLVINGDTSKLTQQQKVDYYRMFCERVGLDPLSQPFKLLRLNGKEIMYCDRSGAQQLNKVHNVSHEIKARETISGCYVVTAQASVPSGRRTESIGAVPIDSLKGDQLCNAMMKAETKAKRRATLDLLGLGILDESETEAMPPGAVQKIEVPAVVSAEKPTTDMKDKMNPFKRKYETVDECRKTLKDTREIKEVASLYYVNAEMIEDDQDLKAEFTTRKNQLYNSQLPDNLKG
jgi:hypothetical protein